MTPSPFPPPDGAPLPFEKDSLAEVLSSSHIFGVEILSVADEAWKQEADGLERRTLKIQARLAQVYKGDFQQAPGDTFDLVVRQEREDAMMVTDYHGLWSHVKPEPAAGVRYLAFSKVDTDAPAGAASLLQQGTCQVLLAPDRAADVVASRLGEKAYRTAQGAATGKPDAELQATRALLAFADARSADAQEPFSRYVFARALPSLLAGGARDELLALLTKPSASPALKFELLVGLDRVMPELGRDLDFARKAGRAMVAVLLDPGARLTHSRIASVSLFLVVFPDEKNPRFTAADLVPDADDRAELQAVLASQPSPRAKQLLSWLST